MNFLPYLFAAFAAALPLLAWYIILHRKQRSGMSKRFWMAFLLAALGAGIFFFWEDDFVEKMNTSTSMLLFSVLILGMAIEYFKNIIVRFTGIAYIKSIDDAIDLSFAAALGFTFAENIFHFGALLSVGDMDPIPMLKLFLIREFFILPIHLFCSGIFGYFYGVGLFAGEELQEKNRKSFWFKFLSILLFFVPKKRRFRAVKILQGTLLSAIFYAIFFTFFWIDPKVSDLFRVLNLPEIPVDESLILLVAFGMFKFGTILFFSFMDKKRRWEKQGLLAEQS